MLKIQDRDFSQYLTDIKVKLVRTYKGDILRTQTGKISAFPTSFITVGLDLAFLAERTVIDSIEQLVLSTDVVSVRFPFKTYAADTDDLLGRFSATAVEAEEVRNKNETHKSLALSLVSDGTDITKHTGAKFFIKKDAAVFKSDCSFGKVYKVPSAGTYYLEGAKVPLVYDSSTTASVLVLGDTTLRSTL